MSEVYQCKYSFMVYYEINKVIIIIIIIIFNLGDFRPDLLILTKDNCLYVLELTVGYETNLRNNIQRKYSKYKEMIIEQKKKFRPVKFINLSISALGVFEKESSDFIQMLEHLNSDKACVKYTIRKIINIAIRTTYYVFCCRNKDWSNPDLMNF